MCQTEDLGQSPMDNRPCRIKSTQKRGNTISFSSQFPGIVSPPLHASKILTKITDQVQPSLLISDVIGHQILEER